MTSTQWQKLTLLQMSELRAGSAFKTHFQGKMAGDFPFIKVSDMNSGENEIAIRSSNNWVLTADAKSMNARPLPTGATVFAKIGEALRQNRVRKLVRPTIVDNNMMGAVPRREIVDPSFLYYLLSNFDIASTANGTALPYLTVSVLGSCEFAVPELTAQQEIASILSAYDDLIENNTQRIAVLEEMARRIFEEWFVHFRAPGCENLPRIDTPLGPVPEGWATLPIDEAYEGLYDGPHATPAPSSVGPVFLGIQNIREAGGLDLSRIRHIDELDFAKWTRRVIPQRGDIIFSYEATLNRYALIPSGLKCCLGRRMALVRPKRNYRLFLYLYFFGTAWRRVVAENTLSGATVDRIPLTNFPRFPVIFPPESLAAQFEWTLSPTFDCIEVLRAVTSNLRDQRDLLLPRLISGEIDVSEAPALLEAAE